MSQFRVGLVLSIAVVLAGCDTGPAGEGESGHVRGSDAPAFEGRGDYMASASVGPIRYRFDPAKLLMAEVLLQVPPVDGDQLWGTKLISARRADMLGQDLCHYGSSDGLETCEAHREPGLVLALLTRPLAHYRNAFVQEGMEGELSPTQLDGTVGFAFTAQADRGGTEYRFLPLNDRTVLLARQFSSELDQSQTIEDVIHSVAKGLSAVTRETD